MRYLFLFLLCVFSFAANGQEKTEANLMAKLFRSLQSNDGKAFGDLFAGVDSLSQWVVQAADKGSVSYRKMLAVQQSDYYKLQFDSSIHEESHKNFNDFLDKAKVFDINWGETIFMRYELEKMRRGRGLLTEKIAKLRFMGYVFFKDQLTQKIYCFTVSDIMQVNGNWYGGELVNIFEADTKEKFEVALAAERKRLRMLELGVAEDTAKAATAAVDGDDHEKPSALKEVAERRYYKGNFDDEIPVVLYVRYIKGPCKEGVCSWEALFKFGDQDDYVKMVVSRTADGKWLFNEELGGMELSLDGNTYTGSYASNSDKTEYDVVFKQTPVAPKKLQALDELLELGNYGQ